MKVKDSSSFKRLKMLSTALSLSCEDNSELCGELLGYSAGIEIVCAYFEKILSQLYPTTTQKTSLDIYSYICNVDKALDSDSALEQIFERLSQQFCTFSDESMDLALKRISEDITYTAGDFSISFSSVTAEELRAFGRVLETYVPIYVFATLDGDGAVFDTWDSFGYSFDEYEALSCPFSVLETVS